MTVAAIHVVIRAGLAAAAIGAGALADAVHSVHFPGIGTLPGTRLVLLGSGIVVLVSATRVTLRETDR